MPELGVREVFEMVTKQIEPDQDSWKEQERRQRVAARNRRIGAFAFAAAAAAVAVIVFVASRGSGGQHPLPASSGPSRTLDQLTPQETALVGLDGASLGVLPVPADAYALSLSTDGSKIAFVTQETGTPQIATINADGSGKQILTNVKHEANEPAWSPDGSRIAFVSMNIDARFDVFVMDIDGGNVRRLTSTPADDQYPDWSPDGTRIVYTDNPGGDEFSRREEIWTVPADGGTAVRLTHNSVSDSQPVWSPDGTQIAFERTGEPEDLWVMAADGTNQRRLDAPAGSFGPTWSPDGSKLAFLRFLSNDATIMFRGFVQRGSPVFGVGVLDVATGEVTNVGSKVVIDLNRVQWMPSGDALVFARIKP